MKTEQFNDTPADAALDGEIRALLAVDPSPQFHASVRTQIANEAVLRSHGAWWRAFGLAVLAAGVVLLALLARPAPRMSQSAMVPMLAARGSIGAGPLIAPPVRVDAAALIKTSAVSVSDVPRTAGDAPLRVKRTSEPEILIAPDERRALRALIAGVRDGSIDLTPVTRATAADVMELEPIRDLVIAPIVITPVEGVHQ